MKEYQYSAFSCYGIEIEYMIVDRARLDVRPIADRLLVGAEDMDVPRGDAAWSNELALHVIETKTAGPISDLERGAQIFRREVDAILALLSEHDALLMPGGMHPWMDPLKETRLWPHQNNEIYAAFDRVFGCQGHGWSNLQSMHINLPFSSEAEFSGLHAACRVVLPLLPAIASSSPYWEGRRAPNLDQRLAVYQTNCRRVPSVTGHVIPEAVFSYAEYQHMLSGIYRDIAPLDPDEILQDEWLNARGAIARFDRGAIEIRVLDNQECPEHDLAIAYFTTELVRALYEQVYLLLTEQKELPTELLATQFQRCVELGQAAPVLPEYGRVFRSSATNMRALFTELLQRSVSRSSRFFPMLDLIAREGTLAERLVRSCGNAPTPQALYEAYQTLCACLSHGSAYA